MKNRLNQWINRRGAPIVKLTRRARHLVTLAVAPQRLVQSGQRPFTVVGQFDEASIRYYPADSATQRLDIPLVMISPLAVTLAIYDLLPQRSLIGFLNGQGVDVYLIDWGGLNRQHRHLDLGYFALQALPALINQIRQHAGTEELSLHGWSMGGLFALFYTAASPAHIRNLIILGSPIDTHAAGWIGRWFEQFDQLSQRMPSRLKQWITPARLPNHLLHSPGRFNALGFQLLSPVRMLTNRVEILRRLDNLPQLQSHMTLANFLDNMIDYPGAVIRDMLFWYWMGNPAKTGQFTLGSQTIDFKRIKSALLVGAGRQDELVSVAAAEPLCHLTGSTDVTFSPVPGGHLGIIASQESQIQFWPVMSAWLIQRSHQSKHLAN